MINLNQILAEISSSKDYDEKNQMLTMLLAAIKSKRFKPKKEEKCDCEKTSCENNAVSNVPMLFTTKTCPNCKMAKMLLEKAGIEVGDYILEIVGNLPKNHLFIPLF